MWILKMKLFKFTIAALSLLVSNALMAGAPSPSGANAYIISPANGETVGKTFTIKFGLQGMGVSPAGLDKKNTGHHHLLVDTQSMPSMNAPMGGNVKHFGGGQTETTVTLAPGAHTLQLVLGDKAHVPHTPPVVSKKITVIVK